MGLRDWFACSACAQKDALLLAQLKQIDNLVALMREAESSRRGVEAALAGVAGDRAAQAAERGMGVAPKQPYEAPRMRIAQGTPRRPLSPFMNSLYGGGHLNPVREDLRTVVQDENPNEAPSAEQE